MFISIITLFLVISCGAEESKENNQIIEKALLGNGSKIHPMDSFEILPFHRNWELEIKNVIIDGTELVLTENKYNDPPDDGTQFLIINIKASYKGEDRDSIATADLQLIGEKNKAYSYIYHNCGSIPDSIERIATVFKYGYIEGNICFMVDSDDIHNLLLFDDNLDSPKYMKIN